MPVLYKIVDSDSHSVAGDDRFSFFPILIIIMECLLWARHCAKCLGCISELSRYKIFVFLEVTYFSSEGREIRQ